MHRFLIPCLIALGLLPRFATGQSLGYEDADNAGEAVGMMQTTLRTIPILESQCDARFPEQAGAMRSGLHAWEVTEAAAIRKSNHYYAQQIKARSAAEQAAHVATLESMIRRSFEPALGMPGDAGTAVARDVCTRYFADLASGVWRQRTPRAYRFLDAVPDVPATARP